MKSNKIRQIQCACFNLSVYNSLNHTIALTSVVYVWPQNTNFQGDAQGGGCLVLKALMCARHDVMSHVYL